MRPRIGLVVQCLYLGWFRSRICIPPEMEGSIRGQAVVATLLTYRQLVDPTPGEQFTVACFSVTKHLEPAVPPSRYVATIFFVSVLSNSLI